MAALVELGSLVLAGGVTDTATKGWFFTDLGDWYTLSPSKSDVRERPQANGAFTIAQDWRQSLAYSIKGVFLGDTHADVQAAKRVLASACGTGKPVTVAVTDVDGRTSRLSSCRQLAPDDDHGRAEFTFTIDFVAFDPFRYGDPVTVTAGVPASGGGLVWPLGSSS